MPSEPRNPDAGAKDPSSRGAGEPIAVDICGRRYNIKGDHDPKTLRALARYVESRMRQLGPQVPPGDALGLAVLAALNIADDYYQTRRTLEQLENEVSERTRRLTQSLSQALEPMERDLAETPDE